MIVKAITTVTKRVVFTVLYDADTHAVSSDVDDDSSSREGSLGPFPTAPTAPSPAAVVAAALAAQGNGHQARRIDQFFIPHGSANSTSSARTIVRLRPRVANQASGSSSASSANLEGIHGPRPRPLHVLSDDEEAARPSKKRKRDASVDSSNSAL